MKDPASIGERHCAGVGVSRSLLFKARALLFADLNSDRLIIGTDLVQGATAPAMGRAARFFILGRKSLLRQRGDIHFFGAKISANGGGFHSYALSCMSVRRMSARAMGSL